MIRSAGRERVSQGVTGKITGYQSHVRRRRDAGALQAAPLQCLRIWLVDFVDTHVRKGIAIRECIQTRAEQHVLAGPTPGRKLIFGNARSHDHNSTASVSTSAIDRAARDVRATPGAGPATAPGSPADPRARVASRAVDERHARPRPAQRSGWAVLPPSTDSVSGAPDTRGWERFANVGRVRHQLDHHHHHQARFRIDAIHRAVGAAPPERALAAHAVGAVAIDGLEAEAESQAGRRMQRADLVGGHQLHRARRQNPRAVERAAAAHRLEEAARSRARSRAGRRRRRNSCAARRRRSPGRARPPAHARTCRRRRCHRRPRSRSFCAGGRKNCVSFMPSGAVM